MNYLNIIKYKTGYIFFSGVDRVSCYSGSDPWTRGPGVTVAWLSVTLVEMCMVDGLGSGSVRRTCRYRLHGGALFRHGPTLKL